MTNNALGLQSILGNLSTVVFGPDCERRRIIRYCKQIALGRVFRFRLNSDYLATTYQPDSHAVFEAYPEFKSLFSRFIKHNTINNSGDIARLWTVILNLNHLIDEQIPGDFAELGVWRGNTASLLAHYASTSDRQVYLFDTFEGFNANDLKGIDQDKSEGHFRNTSIDLVKDVIGEPAERCHFVKGYFPESLQEEHKSVQYAAVSIDCDLYEPIKAGLEFFYPRMPKGGLFLLHDYSSLRWPGAKLAIDEFSQANGEYAVLLPDKSGSAFIRKSA